MPLDPSIHILDIAVSPEFGTDGLIFAATNAGLWRSADGGASWEPAVPELATGGGIAATAVEVSPAFASDGAVLMAIPGGIGMSSDGGTSWRFGKLSPPAPIVSSIALSPTFDRDAIAFLGTVQDGVFRTGNGGETWVPWSPGLLDTSVTALAISPNFHIDTLLFAGTTTGVFRSTNGGRRWMPVDFRPDYHPPVSALVVASVGRGGPMVFAGTETGELWLSADMGDSWRFVDEYAGGEVRAIATTPDSAHARAGVLGEESLVVTSDKGERWTVVADLTVAAKAIVAIAPAGSPGGGLIAATTTGNILRIQGFRT